MVEIENQHILAKSHAIAASPSYNPQAIRTILTDSPQILISLLSLNLKTNPIKTSKARSKIRKVSRQSHRISR